MRELHLFAGAGGGILGGILLGHTTVCAVEVLPFRRKILLQRQRDGILPWFPIWDDIRTFNGSPWRGGVDVVCGGFPCQDISLGGKGQGINGKRSGLWKEMARVVCEVQPKYVFVENSPALVVRGLGQVLGDLAKMGYDARWGVLGVGDAGGLHQRNRIWILAYSHSNKELEPWKCVKTIQRQSAFSWCKDIRSIKDLQDRLPVRSPVLLRTNHDVANQLDRIEAIGDGQVPAVVKLAWETLMP